MLFSHLRALSQCGHVLTIAESSEQAIHHLRSRRDHFDLVMCDVVLPGIDGLQVLALNSVPKGSTSTH